MSRDMINTIVSSMMSVSLVTLASSLAIRALSILIAIIFKVDITVSALYDYIIMYGCPAIGAVVSLVTNIPNTIKEIFDNM